MWERRRNGSHRDRRVTTRARVTYARTKQTPDLAHERLLAAHERRVVRVVVELARCRHVRAPDARNVVLEVEPELLLLSAVARFEDLDTTSRGQFGHFKI